MGTRVTRGQGGRMGRDRTGHDVIKLCNGCIHQGMNRNYLKRLIKSTLGKILLNGKCMI